MKANQITMLNFVKYFKYFRYIPKTVYVNRKLKSYSFIKEPFVSLIVTSRLNLQSDPSAIIKATPGSYLRLGYGSGGIATFEYTGINLELHVDSVISLDGVSNLGYGSSICVYPNAHLHIGNRTYLAGNALIKCANFIQIGNDCAISWNVSLIDSDFHTWAINDNAKEISRAIIIEDHVWIGNSVIVLKGVTIGSGSIVGAGSVVTKSVPPHTLVAGNPARVISKDVDW